MKRTLTLKTERLVELTDRELTDVAGAAATQLCSNAEICYFPSRIAMSLCGCLTNYCSIDVC